MNDERTETTDPNSLLESFALQGNEEKILVDFFRSNTHGELKFFEVDGVARTRIQVVAGQALFEGNTETGLWLSLCQSPDYPLTLSFADSENALRGHVGHRLDANLLKSSDGKTAFALRESSDYIFLNTRYGRWALLKLKELSQSFESLSD